MPMDSKFTGKDYLNDSSHRRCFVAYKISSKRYDKMPEQIVEQLGSEMYTFQTESDEVILVEGMDRKEKRTTYTEGRILSTSRDYMGRCFRQRLGSSFFLRDDEWVLEPRRASTSHQFKRTINDPFCSTITRQKIRKLNHSNFFRQHHRHKIRQQIRRSRIRASARRGYTNIRITQQISARSTGISHSRHIEHPSRQAQPEDITAQRMDITQTLVSAPTAHMGKEEHEDRCLRIKNQSPTSDLLEPSSGPIGDSNGCISTELTEERFVFESTVETNPEGNTKAMLDQGSRRIPDNSTVADTLLVAHADKVENDRPADNNEDKKLDFDRLEVIKHKKEED
ncbi:hypothetical protein RMCBS344292_07423 [Rhizopus microsporus]|nr:hypothetical protein RMCBS344292_07423 [Rhizopus microsporus]